MLMLSWSKPGPRASNCPVCAMQGMKQPVLQIFGGRGGSRSAVILQCAACQARYADPMHPADYEKVDRDGLKFYLEQGAGIRTMLEPFLLADARPIRRYLEIGCGFGFVMDYGRRMFGWQVQGFDPGFIAAAGREALALPIENRYFAGVGPKDAKFDLVFCSEVLEHIADPGQFVQRLRNALTENGLLLLTTPNGDALVPGTPEELLLPILSPGQHVILYNGAAVTTLLQGGFTHIRVSDRGHQLHVAASTVPFVGASSHFSPELYRRYLEQAVRDHDAMSSLGAGLLCRLLKEELNRGQYAAAQRLYDRLQHAYRHRYGFDTETLKLGDFRQAAPASFREFSKAWPLNLAGVLYARGLIRLLHEGEPQPAARTLHVSMRFGSELRARLRAIGTDDAESAHLCREAEIARLHALARCRPAAAVAALRRLSADNGDVDSASAGSHADRARRRVFVDLINLGHYKLAEKLVETMVDPECWAAQSADDTAFAWGIYLLNHRSDFAAAAAVFGKIWERSSRSPRDDNALIWAARFHQGLACRYQGDYRTAALIAAEISTEPAPVPEELRRRTDELVAASPAIGEG